MIHFINRRAMLKFFGIGTIGIGAAATKLGDVQSAPSKEEQLKVFHESVKNMQPKWKFMNVTLDEVMAEIGNFDGRLWEERVYRTISALHSRALRSQHHGVRLVLKKEDQAPKLVIERFDCVVRHVSDDLYEVVKTREYMPKVRIRIPIKTA